MLEEVLTATLVSSRLCSFWFPLLDFLVLFHVGMELILKSSNTQGPLLPRAHCLLTWILFNIFLSLEFLMFLMSGGWLVMMSGKGCGLGILVVMELIFNVEPSFSKDVTWLLLNDFDSSTCDTHLFVNFQLVNLTQALPIKLNSNSYIHNYKCESKLTCGLEPSNFLIFLRKTMFLVHSGSSCMLFNSSSSNDDVLVAFSCKQFDLNVAVASISFTLSSSSTLYFWNGWIWGTKKILTWVKKKFQKW